MFFFNLQPSEKCGVLNVTKITEHGKKVRWVRLSKMGLCVSDYSVFLIFKILNHISYRIWHYWNRLPSYNCLGIFNCVSVSLWEILDHTLNHQCIFRGDIIWCKYYLIVWYTFLRNRKNWTSSWTVLRGSSLQFAKSQGGGTSWVSDSSLLVLGLTHTYAVRPASVSFCIRFVFY